MHERSGFWSRSPEKLAVFGPIDGEFNYSPHSSTRTIRIATSLDALETALEPLKKAIAGWIATSSDWEHRGEDERAPALERLRDAGHALFNVLEGPKPGELRQALQGVTYLEVKVRRPHIPWEFLYLGDPTGEVDVHAFLGASLVVGRPFDMPFLPNNPTAPVNDRGARDVSISSKGLFVAVAEDDRLESAASGRERQIFERHDVPIHLLPSIVPGSPLEPIARFLEGSVYLTHFNCHATEEDPRASQEGALEVTERYRVSRTQIAALPVCEESLVVLNCCHGHTLRHTARETLATAFAQHQISAVVAATEKIVDDYATLWAEFFYEELLRGEVVGIALLKARQRLIRETGNPACLVYGFHGRFSASLSDPQLELAA